MGLRALKIEDADEAVLKQERYDQLGADLDSVTATDKTRILADVSHANNTARSGSGASESFVQTQASAHGDGILVPHCENGIEELRRLVPKLDRECVVVHEALDALSYAAKKFLAVEDGSQLAAHFIEQR
jgi:hypothetical protein